MFNNFLMIIAAVFIVTIAFGMLILRQFKSFERKAQKAKRRQEEYLKERLAQKDAAALEQHVTDPDKEIIRD